MAGRQQLFPQRLIVVNLPIEHQHQRLIFIIQRLISRLQINDAQAPEAHRHPVAAVNPFRIRSPVGDPLRHLPDDLLPIRQFPGKSAKSAHGV